MKNLYLLGLFCVTFSTLVGAGPVFDFDGDGADDLGIYHWQTGNWFAFGSADGAAGWNWGGPSAQPVLGDFDGDGKTDPAVYDTQSHVWTIFLSGSGQVVQHNFGRPGMVPVVADYDGDGKADLALYERSTGLWVIRGSQSGGEMQLQFGWGEARPVPGDYDGDGKADMALYHRHTGMWYMFGSSEGYRTVQFGNSEARPVPGDYDGDGRTDVGVYMRKTGKWLIYGSSMGFKEAQWGFSTARPVPGDYDGDGITDFAVFERETAKWYIWLSESQAPRIEIYGWSMATPLQSYQHGGLEGGVILCFGDSITFGIGSSGNGPATGYPARLMREAGPALGGMFDFVNKGVSGEITASGRNRIHGVLSATRPEWVLLMEGTNDHFFNIRYQQILDNYTSMIGTSRSYSADVLLATTPPVISNQFRDRDMQAARIRGFNPSIHTLGQNLNVPIVPVYEAITSRPLWQQTLIEPFSSNHPNDAGYEVIAETFLNSLRQAIMDGRLY
ncbi:MAG: GDSL-type esterase/lipase family protein [Kiritimatiellia bacterium]